MGGTRTSGIAASFGIRLDREILADHSVFFPQAFYNNVLFEVMLVPASQVVRSSDLTKLKYKLTNIQLAYGMICSDTL